MKRTIKNIVILGSGNVATHLALRIHDCGYNIKQIYSKTLKNAKLLSQMVSAAYTDNLAAIFDDADLYIISLKDDVLETVISSSSLKEKTLVHTSGSVSIDAFKNHTDCCGVMYPFQTFSKNRHVDFDKVPILLEANNPEFLEVLEIFANSLSNQVLKVDSNERAMLHIAAVFACNFTNHMYAIAEDITKKNNLPFDLLKPLIAETAQKIMSKSPSEAQTGPAHRFDNKIVTQHQISLTSNPHYNEIYKLLSKSIQELKIHNDDQTKL